MAKYERPTKVNEPKIVMEGTTAEAASIQKDVVENIAKEKFVKLDQANAYSKGHNFKDTIVEVKKYDPFVTTMVSNATLQFPLCSINYLSQRISQDEVGRLVSTHVGDNLVAKVFLVDGKDEQKVLAVLNKNIVVNYSSDVKYAIDKCKTGEEFRIIKDNIKPELKALMSENTNVSQYGENLVVVLDPVKVVESVIIPAQLDVRTDEVINLVKLGKVKIAKRQIFYAIKTEGALSSVFNISVKENNFVACDLNVPYSLFMKMVQDEDANQVFTHFYEKVVDENGRTAGKLKLVKKIPTVKYFDVLKIVGADIKDSAVRRQMLGITEASVSRAPILKLDNAYIMGHKKTGNPLLDAIYAQNSNYTQVETRLDVDAIMRDFGFLLNGEVHTYNVGGDNYLLVDTKKLFISTMFSHFYGYNNENKFKFKITVNPDTTYGIGCTMSI